MPRQPRHRQQAICYQIYNRGWDRATLFHGPDDFDRFVQTLLRYKSAFGVEVFHWALMANHYHLLIRADFPRLRPFVAGVQQSYTQYHHLKHESCGTLWQGRFQSKPVETDASLTRCGRYIERNPVRAKQAARAWKWPWSSAAFYAKGKPDDLTDFDPQLARTRGGQLSKPTRSAYARLLDDDADDVWMADHTGAVIGSKRFASKFHADNGHLRPRTGPPRKVRKSTKRRDGKTEVGRRAPQKLAIANRVLSVLLQSYAPESELLSEFVRVAQHPLISPRIFERIFQSHASCATFQEIIAGIRGRV